MGLQQQHQGESEQLEAKIVQKMVAQAETDFLPGFGYQDHSLFLPLHFFEGAGLEH